MSRKRSLLIPGPTYVANVDVIKSWIVDNGVNAVITARPGYTKVGSRRCHDRTINIADEDDRLAFVVRFLCEH